MKNDIPPESDPETAVGKRQLFAVDLPPGSEAQTSKVSRRVIVGIATLVGAGGAFAWFRNWSSAVIGILVGLVFGLQIVRMRNPDKDDFGLPKFCSKPVWVMALSVVAWAAVSVVWLGSLLAGWLRGEGAGLLLMFIVLPLTTFFWLIGGPMVSQAARHSLRQIGSGRRPETDRATVRLALTLSRLMSLAFFSFLLWLLVSLFR
ncbi:MAG TPA: hypothetical protein PLX89_03425 [Verrucomicrobiota bacterium]|nr:hypothetical protein [Verrucomicrobiota bacterium]